MAYASPFRPRIVGGLDYATPYTPALPDIVIAPVIGRASKVVPLHGPVDLTTLTLSAAFSTPADRVEFAGMLRFLDVDGLGIADFVCSLGTFIMDMADDAFGIGYDLNAEVPFEVTLAEYMRIRQACDLAGGRSHPVMVHAFASTSISFAFDHSRAGIDLARDARMLLDAERAGMGLRDLADALDAPR